jgi:hypothetical protein
MDGEGTPAQAGAQTRHLWPVASARGDELAGGGLVLALSGAVRLGRNHTTVMYAWQGQRATGEREKVVQAGGTPVPRRFLAAASRRVVWVFATTIAATRPPGTAHRTRRVADVLATTIAATRPPRSTATTPHPVADLSDTTITTTRPPRNTPQRKRSGAAR